MIKYIIIIIYCLIGYLIAKRYSYKYEFNKVKVMVLWPIFIIIRPILRIIDFFYGGKLPKLSCYGCIRENCKNRSWIKNRLCKGYEKGGDDQWTSLK